MVLVLLVYLETVPAMARQQEVELCERWSEALRIVSLSTSDSTIADQLLRFRQNLSDHEKVRASAMLERAISSKLQAHRISPTIINTITPCCVASLVNSMELVKARPGESIVLHLRCLTLESLWKLREMVLSGLLLRLFSEAIKQFIQSQPQVRLIVKREDFNKCVSYFTSAAGNLYYFS